MKNTQKCRYKMQSGIRKLIRFEFINVIKIYEKIYIYNFKYC